MSVFDLAYRAETEDVPVHDKPDQPLVEPLQLGHDVQESIPQFPVLDARL